MDEKEFSVARQELQKTQRQMAELLGTSLKAVQSFEQGWRKVPVHIERQVLFLISARQGFDRKSQPCWDIRNCSLENREACPAWEFNLGQLCWFVNGTICRGETLKSWPQKMTICRTCAVFTRKMKMGDPEKKGRSRFRRWGKKGKAK